MWSKKYNEKNTILNMRLSKIIGLCEILHPSNSKIFGYNISHVVVTFFLLYEIIILTLCLVGIYFWMSNMLQVVLQLTILPNFSFGCYKMFILIRKTDKIRRSTKLVCNDFMKFKHYENVFFNNFRMKSILSTYTYVIMGNFILLVWSISPIIFNTNYIILKNPNGVRHSYRLSAFNMFFPVSSETYNNYFIIFHILEVVFGFVYVIFSHIFDTLLISMCFAISSNLKTIGNAYATLGRKYTTKYSK